MRAMTIDRWHAWPLCGCRPPRDGEIYVVRASLEMRGSERAQGLRTILSAAETDRAMRYHKARDAEKYILSHGMLRELLAGFIGAEPASIVIEEMRLGKPHLAAPEAVHFSMSVSGCEALYAFAADREVGVDVERIDLRLVDFDAPALPRAERERLAALDPTLRPKAFFEAWTRAEAILKAEGFGLGGGDTGLESARMTVIDCRFSPEYAAALAAPGSDFIISAWILPEGGCPSRVS